MCSINSAVNITSFESVGLRRVGRGLAKYQGEVTCVIDMPVFDLESSIDEIDELIKEFCETIKPSSDYHALAWCFPKETRKLHGGDEYHYPGIVMLVKNIEFE